MATTGNSESVDIRSGGDVVVVRQKVRDWAVTLGFRLVDQTRLVTAASELARNTLQYGGGGSATIEALSNGVSVTTELVAAP